MGGQCRCTKEVRAYFRFRSFATDALGSSASYQEAPRRHKHSAYFKKLLGLLYPSGLLARRQLTARVLIAALNALTSALWHRGLFLLCCVLWMDLQCTSQRAHPKNVVVVANKPFSLPIISSRRGSYLSIFFVPSPSSRVFARDFPVLGSVEVTQTSTFFYTIDTFIHICRQIKVLVLNRGSLLLLAD